MNTKKLAYLGLVTALAAILGYVEALIPFDFMVPGIKLGLANLVIVFVLMRYSWKDAAVVSLARIFLVGFMFGNFSMIMYSIAGAAVSLTVMTFLMHKCSFSPIGTSVAGGVAHNMGQLIVAMLVVHNLNLITYAPVLLVAGVVTGLLIGIVTSEVSKRLP